MLGRYTHVDQGELAAGMLVRRGWTWVRIEHIAACEAGSNQRKGTCTLEHQLGKGGFTVWFLSGRHKVRTESLPPDFAIKPTPKPEPVPEPESEPETQVDVRRGVTNIIEGTVHGTTIQAGTINGQSASDYFKNR